MVANACQNGVAKPAALACRQCRAKHLKCDGLNPTCSRCLTHSLVCIYTPSRRGFRNQDRRSSRSVGPQTPSVSLGVPKPTNTGDVLGSSAPGFAREPGLCGSDGTGSPLNTGPAGDSDHRTPLREPNGQFLENLYYSCFHPTHPFLVPRNRYARQAYPSYLKLVVQFVGSHFAPNLLHSISCDMVQRTLGAIQDPSVYLVQSLLLLSIVLHSRNDREIAFNTIDRAALLAIELGMNCESFATNCGLEDTVLEQSLRRTWWELFVVNGFLAALHRKKNFRCNTVELSALLPCDEHQYVEGMQLSESTALTHMDRRFFASEEQRFSSGSYRVEAVRLIARVSAVTGAGEERADNVQAVDNAIVAWKYHLPREKAGMIDRLGDFDQMMFQAHMFIHSAEILLHFSRSELLVSLPAHNRIACSERMLHASPMSEKHAHKAITASKALSDLAALPADRYSPLFVCGLTFGCLVQLATCSAHASECAMQHRERVALMTGALKRLSQEWPISAHALQQLKRMASEVFDSARQPSTATSVFMDSAVDVQSDEDFGDWLNLFQPGDFADMEGLPEADWNSPVYAIPQ